LLAAASLTPGVQAAFKANLGAVVQTQVELTGYHWPDSKFQDAIRRSSKHRLAPAIVWYQSALATDATNATANRRLGQIALSLGQYDAAQVYLAAAFAAAPNQRATRQMLGECYAMAGEIEQAAQLWRTMDIGQGQLMVRQWWYGDFLGEWERAGRIAQAASLLDKRLK
jgi:predicted Zn-dependent protease